MIPASTSRLSGPTSLGLGLTLASTFIFSWLGIVTQLAYEAGASIGTLLSGRFVVAAAVLWPIVLITRRRAPTRGQVVAGLALGAGYSIHALLFSESLARIDAGLVDLLLFTYPALVMLGAVALRRDRWNERRALALGSATAGTFLVLVGGLGSIDTAGAFLALGSAVAYAAYILISAGQLGRTDPLTLVALVSTGAAVTLTARGTATGDIALDVGAPALLHVALVGLVAVVGMGTFVAGIGNLGPSRASIVSAAQPALTPVLGFAVFADKLGPAQVAGGALVVAGILILEIRGSALARLSSLSRRVLTPLAPSRRPIQLPGNC